MATTGTLHELFSGTYNNKSEASFLFASPNLVPRFVWEGSGRSLRKPGVEPHPNGRQAGFSHLPATICTVVIAGPGRRAGTSGW